MARASLPGGAFSLKGRDALSAPALGLGLIAGRGMGQGAAKRGEAFTKSGLAGPKFAQSGMLIHREARARGRRRAGCGASAWGRSGGRPRPCGPAGVPGPAGRASGPAPALWAQVGRD